MTQNDAIDFDLGDAVAGEEKPEATPDDLKRLVALGHDLLEEQAKADKMAEELAEQKKIVSRLELTTIPDLMSELEIPMIAVNDANGNPLVLTLESDVKAGLTQKTRPLALRWLKENGFGGLIKSAVTVPFDKDHQEDAEEFAKRIGEEFANAEYKEDVHNATLRSFVKEQLEKGADIPQDVFGVHQFKKVTVKKG